MKRNARIAARRAKQPSVLSAPRQTTPELDFSPKSSSPESAAKSALLSDDPRKNAIALVGMGGTGKTTILRALARRPEIWAKFSDGVWFVQLGHDVTLQSFLIQIQTLVKYAFPDFLQQFEELATVKDTHDTLVNNLTELMADKRLLILFDDVWDTNESFELVRAMYMSVQQIDGNSFKIITSTRSWEIGRAPYHDESIAVRPEYSSAEKVRRILFRHACIDYRKLTTLSPKNSRALNCILDTCAGLPLAIGVAGSSIRGMMDSCIDVSDQDVFVEYWECLETNVSQLGTTAINNYKGLFASLQSSLQIMANLWKCKRISIDSMFRSLCVLKKQMVLPLSVAEKLWDVSHQIALEGVLLLSRKSVASLQRSERGRIEGLRLHDVVHDLSVQMAQGEEGVQVWHDKLLNGFRKCKTTSARARKKQKSSDTQWWSLSYDNYFTTNVIWHMIAAGRATDALQLLTDYRWIQKMNEGKDCVPFQKIISDMRTLREYLKQQDGIDVENNVAHDIELIMKTMLLCRSPYCIEHRRQCTFQLQGRLAALKSDSLVVKRLLWSIEQYARRPWARAGPGVLRSVKSGLNRVLYLQNIVVCMTMGLNEDELVVGGEHGVLWVASTTDGSTKYIFHGKHDREIVDVCTDRDQGLIYSCGEDGRVMLWQDYQRVHFLQVDILEEEEIICSMQVLLQQQIVALGTNRGRLILLEIASGKSKAVNGHSDMVTSLAAGQSEDLLCSGSWNGTIRLWNARTSKPRGSLADCHTRKVNCWSLSSDESFIALGSHDGTIRLWDVSEQRQVWQSSSGHKGSVIFVTFNSNGQLLYSGDLGGTICVWKLRSGDAEVHLMHTMHHALMRSVASLLVGYNSSEIFALSEFSNQVYVWDAKERSDDSNDDTDSGGFLSDVKMFAISEDETTMATWNEQLKRIEIRSMSDVNNNIDNVLTSFQLPRDQHPPIGSMIVSNKHVVAYCWDRKCEVHVVDMRSGKELPTFSELEQWACSLSGDYSRHLKNMSFISDGSYIKATAVSYSDLNTNEGTENLLSWDISTGEQVHVPSISSDISSLSSMDDIQVDSGNYPATNSTPQLISEQHDILGFSSDVQYKDDATNFTIASTEHQLSHTHYCGTTSRLWFSRRSGGLEHIALIEHRTQLTQCSEPRLPELVHPMTAQSQLTNASSSVDECGDEVYDVFISHAGHDKWPIANPLCKALVAKGLKVFFDNTELRPGQNASQKMNQAMKTAKIALVILSPQFAARHWTTKELLCFIERFRREGERGMVIIPVFYRLSLEDCRKNNCLELLNMTDENGEKIFEKEKFGELIAGNSKLISDVLDALELLRGITGIENLEKATNQSGDVEKEKRENLILRIVDAIVSAKKRLDDGTAAGPGDS